MAIHCSACSFAFAPSADLALVWPSHDPVGAFDGHGIARAAIHPPPHRPDGPPITFGDPRGPWCPGADRPAVE